MSNVMNLYASRGNGQSTVALIRAIFPSTATCYAFYNDILLSAPQGSSDYVFNIPTLGYWRIYIMEGDKEPVYEYVNITTVGQVATVTLTFWEGELYDPGDEHTDITGGWEGVNGYWTSSYSDYPPDGPYIDPTTTHLFFRVYESGTHNGTAATLTTHNKVNLTGYNTLYVTTSASTGYSNCRKMSVSTVNTGELQNVVANSISITSNNSVQTASLDVSSLDGLYYVLFTIWNRNNSAASLTITKIWLE